MFRKLFGLRRFEIWCRWKIFGCFQSLLYAIFQKQTSQSMSGRIALSQTFSQEKKCRDIYAAGFFIWYRNAFPTFSRVQIVVFETIWTKIHLTLFSFHKKLFLRIILVVRIKENFYLQLNEYSLNKKRVTQPLKFFSKMTSTYFREIKFLMNLKRRVRKKSSKVVSLLFVNFYRPWRLF